MKKVRIILLVSMQCLLSCNARTMPEPDQKVIVGAARMDFYLPLLGQKAIGLVANHSALVGDQHLTDTLIGSGVRLVRVFSPEHGFRGTADAGEAIGHMVDKVTCLPIVSLYGERKKPTADDLAGIEMMVFDIQDVGVRFYTYISTLHYVMEACAENGIPLVVLDRPNPNGQYIDGPLLDERFKSYVGMHPVPLVHGLTVGEYASMINGEGWLANGISCNLTVIICLGYSRLTRYELPVPPSPNLRNMRSVYLYPSFGLLEGTIMSMGRGTMWPFQVIGHPNLPGHSFIFTPQAMEGAKNPPYKGRQCFGIDLTGLSTDSLFYYPSVNLEWLIAAYEAMNLGHSFFNSFFDRLAGTDQLRKQIIGGVPITKIREGWQDGLANYDKMRCRYLLYP